MPEKQTVYLVVASEDSDHTAWIVHAFTAEAEASEEAARLAQIDRQKWRAAKNERDWVPGAHPPDDYTVVAVPIGVSGKWELP